MLADYSFPSNNNQTSCSKRMDANLVILDNFKKVKATKATVKGSRDNYRWLGSMRDPERDFSRRSRLDTVKITFAVTCSVTLIF